MVWLWKLVMTVSQSLGQSHVTDRLPVSVPRTTEEKHERCLGPTHTGTACPWLKFMASPWQCVTVSLSVRTGKVPRDALTRGQSLGHCTGEPASGPRVPMEQGELPLVLEQAASGLGGQRAKGRGGRLQAQLDVDQGLEFGKESNFISINHQ